MAKAPSASSVAGRSSRGTTRFYFVRHGAHDQLDRVLCGRMAGVSLSAEGVAQARLTAARLKREQIAVLYSSPLPRALETAAEIGRTLGLAPGVVEALNEVDMGDWTGLEFEALHADPNWKLWNRRRSQARPPRGESLVEVAARLAAWMEEVRARFPDGGAAAVTHGEVIKLAVAGALGLSLDRLGHFEVSPASISIVLAGGWGRKVLSLNEGAS
ncbi:MAG: histidine phosphatase family protein [Caulobacteraceae bacterium]